MLSLINIIIALVAAVWFFRRARATGKDPARWALCGAAAYFIPASILTGLLLGIWQRSVLLALVPLEIHFFTTGQVIYPLLLVLFPSVIVGWIVTLHVFCAALSGETARRMNERTYAFEAAAVLLALVGWIAGPGLPRAASSREYVGQPVFAEFTDPTGVVSLEVVRYDPKDGKLIAFQVTKDARGVWSIPSHEGYAADAQDHLAEVARSLKGLEILDLASEDSRYREQYDVVEPTESNKGTAGLGMKVTLVDREQKPYSLIIGKEVPEWPGRRYVRVAGQDATLVVKLQTQMFSTDFGDWIEKNLLKIDAQDIKSVTMADYSIERQGVERRGRVIVEGTDAPGFSEPGKPEMPRWKLIESKIDKDRKWVDAPLAADEELDASKLDSLKHDLRGLAIVDVARKEEILAKYLREQGKFPPAIQAEQFVAPYGFHMVQVSPDILEYLRTLVPAKEKTLELLSGQGDLRVATKEGIVYVLRFGNVASTSPGAEKGKKTPAKPEAAKKEAEKKDPEAAQAGGANVNRFLFIMAEFDPDVLPKPQVVPLPELPKPDEPAKAKSPEASKADAAKKEDPATKPEAAKKEEPAKKTDPEAQRKQIEAMRKEIEAANKTRQKDFDAKVEEGKKKAQELNERFANWFYVISDSEYQKIHLSRKDIIKKKEAPKKEGTGTPGAILGLPEIPGFPIPPGPPPAAPGAQKEEPAPKKEAPAPTKEEPPAAKKEEPSRTGILPVTKPDPAAAAKKELPAPPPTKESPAPAPKKEPPPPPPPVKTEPPPPPKKVEPAAKKEAPAPPPKPLEPDPAKK
jgi:hypothetical protein